MLWDSEIRNIITEAHQKALTILKQHYDLMDLLSRELLEKETLGTDDIFGLILRAIPESDRELVQKKYNRALEMRFDHNEPTETSQPEMAEQAEEESPQSV